MQRDNRRTIINNTLNNAWSVMEFSIYWPIFLKIFHNKFKPTNTFVFASFSYANMREN